MDVSGVESNAQECSKPHWTTPDAGVVHWDKDADEGKGGYVWCARPGWHFVLPDIADDRPGDPVTFTKLGNYERNRR